MNKSIYFFGELHHETKKPVLKYFTYYLLVQAIQSIHVFGYPPLELSLHVIDLADISDHGLHFRTQLFSDEVVDLQRHPAVVLCQLIKQRIVDGSRRLAQKLFAKTLLPSRRQMRPSRMSGALAVLSPCNSISQHMPAVAPVAYNLLLSHVSRHRVLRE